jgi:hypothetical protein
MGAFMKFVIAKQPLPPNVIGLDPYYNSTIEHLESIVKAQGELLQRFVEIQTVNGLSEMDADYTALQQAIKEAQS